MKTSRATDERGLSYLWKLGTLALAVSVAAVAVSPVASAGVKAGPGTVRIFRDTKDPRWLHGTVVVAAPAEQVIERVQHVDQWPTFLSDIKQLKVKSKGKAYWLAEIESRTMNCGSHDYHIRVKPDRSMSFVIDATALSATGYIHARPGVENQSTSTIQFDLFVETTGVIGWFIPDSAVRSRQEGMLRRDLADLARAFAN